MRIVAAVRPAPGSIEILLSICILFKFYGVGEHAIVFVLFDSFASGRGEAYVCRGYIYYCDVRTI